MLRKLLENIGLNANEAKVYLACLKLGTQDVKVIAREVGLGRAETALVLTSLLDRGFVSKFSHVKDFYTPEHPKTVLKIMENDRVKVDESIRSLRKMLPRLEQFTRPGFTKPEIAYYEGKYGLIAAYEDTLTSKTDILAITSIDDIEHTLPTYIPRYYKRRKTAGILIKAIFPDTPMSRKRQKRDQQEFRLSRLLPQSVMDIHIEFNIYDDKVAYFSLEEQLAVIVRSKVIAESMREIFSICWKMAAPATKKAKSAKRGR